MCEKKLEKTALYTTLFVLSKQVRQSNGKRNRKGKARRPWRR
jgi:hypothetical protein